MTHLDDDRLAAIGLGDIVPGPDDLEHLDTCGTCRGVLDDLARVHAVARSTPRDPGWETPPDRVWHAVAAELPRSARPSRGRLAPALVAAACLLGGLVGGLVVAQLVEDPGPSGTDQASRTISRADLDSPEPDSARVGTASLVERDGELRLRVELDPQPPDGGYLELWLIDEDLQQMVAVGVLRDVPTQEFAVPRDLIDRGYVVVDVSREQYDEDPTHSGVVVGRGTLPT